LIFSLGVPGGAVQNLIRGRTGTSGLVQRPDQGPDGSEPNKTGNPDFSRIRLAGRRRCGAESGAKGWGKSWPGAPGRHERRCFSAPPTQGPQRIPRIGTGQLLGDTMSGKACGIAFRCACFGGAKNYGESPFSAARAPRQVELITGEEAKIVPPARQDYLVLHGRIRWHRLTRRPRWSFCP